MKLRNYWLSWPLAAALVAFAYPGAALAQVPTPTSTPGTAREAHQGGVRPNIIPVSPEAQRKAEEYSRTHGYFTVEPPHPAMHWPNGVPPKRYHRTAPPTPSSGGSDRTAELSRSV
jgi:hypothetical protein